MHPATKHRCLVDAAFYAAPGHWQGPPFGGGAAAAGLITPAALASSLQTQQRNGTRERTPELAEILVEQHDLSQDQIAASDFHLAGRVHGRPAHLQPEPDALALVPRTVAERESVLPLLVRDESLALLIGRPVRPDAAQRAALSDPTAADSHQSCAGYPGSCHRQSLQRSPRRCL